MTGADPRRACEREPLTLAYLAGDLAGEERASAEAHLAGCDACRETAALFARLLAEETPEETLVLELFARRTAAEARETIRGDASEDVVVVAPEARRPEAHRAGTGRWVVWVAVAAAVLAALLWWISLRT